MYWAILYPAKKLFLKISRKKTLEVFFNIIALKTFQKIVWKSLQLSPFLGKVTGCRSTTLDKVGSPATVLKWTPLEVFFCEFFKKFRILILYDKHWHLRMNPVISNTAQKMKFSIKDIFSKCDQIRRKLQIWLHLLKEFNGKFHFLGGANFSGSLLVYLVFFPFFQIFCLVCTKEGFAHISYVSFRSVIGIK